MTYPATPKIEVIRPQTLEYIYIYREDGKLGCTDNVDDVPVTAAMVGVFVNQGENPQVG